MYRHQLNFETFIGHAWKPFDASCGGTIAAARSGSCEFDPRQREAGRAGQTLREVLEELQTQRGLGEVEGQDVDMMASTGVDRLQTLAGATGTVSQWPGHEAGKRRSQRITGLKVPDYRQKRKITRVAKRGVMTTEKLSSTGIDIAQTLGEASADVGEEESSQAVEQTPQEVVERFEAAEQASQEVRQRSQAVEQAPQDVEDEGSAVMQEEWRSTGVDSMDM
jgi:hypothetical protein